jgi:hypothetical protein
MKLTQINLKTEQTKGYLFYAGILTLIMVIVWITTGVYYAVRNVEPDAQMAKLVKPLDPNLDTDVIFSYQQSREPAPEQFLITVTQKDTNETLTTILDPFSNQSVTVTPTPEPETVQLETSEEDLPISTPSATQAE